MIDGGDVSIALVKAAACSWVVALTRTSSGRVVKVAKVSGPGTVAASQAIQAARRSGSSSSRTIGPASAASSSSA